MREFQFQTLGELRLTGREGDRLTGRRKELVLLAYLARRSPRAVPRDELASLLWEDRDEGRARQSLRQALLQLKRVLGDSLEANADTARLADHVVELDVIAFETEVAAGRLAEAVERWRGEFLTGADDSGGEAFRTWIEAERESLRRRLGWALERLLDQAAAANDLGASARWAERWTTALPFDERAELRRIEFLRRSGRVAEALASHGAFITRLRQELEVEPSTEMLQLGAELQAAGRSGPVASPGSAALFTPDLTGRAAALGELTALWNAVRNGRSASVLIEGEEGIGKTRLCDEFLRRLRESEDPGFVLQARAAESDVGVSWATARRLLENLRQAPGLGGAPATALAEVSELVPALRERFSNLPPASRQERALDDGLRSVLREVAVDAPILILVDDFQWADQATQSLLAHLRALPPRILVVLTARTAELESAPVVKELKRLTAIRRLKLQPLSLAEVENLIDSMLTLPEEQRPGLAERVHAEGEGNPFYTVELIAGLADARLIVLDPSGTWRITGELAGRPLPLPATVREAARQRLRHLPDHSRRVAHAAAVLGRQVDASLLESVAGLMPAEFSAALDDLMARRLLRESGAPGSDYEFTHEIQRRVAYELQTPAERQARHRAAFLALEARPADDEAARDTREYHRQRAGQFAPSRRRRWPVMAAVGGGVLAAVGALVFWRDQPAAASPGNENRLLVVAFKNETGDPSLNSLGRIAADWISQGVAKTNLVRVVPPALNSSDSIGFVGEDLSGARVRNLAVGAEAGLVIWGSYYWSGDSLQLQAELTDVAKGELLVAIGPVRGARQNPMPAVEALRQQTQALLASRLDPRLAAAASVQGSPPSYESYLEFALGLDYSYRRQGDSALVHFFRAYALDTSYTLPLLYALAVFRGQVQLQRMDSLVQVLLPRRSELAPYERHLLDFYAASDRAAAYNAARAAAEIAPQSPFAASDLPQAALGLNLPRQALEYLSRIDPERGEGTRLRAHWAWQSAALHFLGLYERQLEVGKLVRRRFPDDDRSYFYQARALAALGRLDELDAVLNESLQLPGNGVWGPSAVALHSIISDELRVHDHPEHARVILQRAVAFYEKAPALLQNIPMHRFAMGGLMARLGRLDEARRLLEGVRAGGGAIGASELVLHGEIGAVAALQRDMAAVEEHDRWLREATGPHLNGVNTEYRARMAAILGRKEEAMRLLQQATTEGYGFGMERHAGYELQGLRGYPPFEEFMRPKG